MLISENVELDFDDVLLLPNRSKASSRKDVELNRELRFYHSSRTWNGIPIFAANMSSVGTFAMANSLIEEKMCCALHKHYPLKELRDYYASIGWKDDNYAWYTTGIREEDIEKLLQFSRMTSIIPNIVIDVPNGYTDNFVNTCAKIRERFSPSIIMAGNVCTGEMVQELILHGGVDIVKIGIGGGKNCSTRMITGVGRPQLSAIIECASAAHNLKSDDKRLGLVCADGGCSSVGDICKAYAAGADFVMLGNMFAGCEECDGEWTYNFTKQYTHPDKDDKNSLLHKYINAGQKLTEGQAYAFAIPGHELYPNTSHAYCYTSDINKHGLIEKDKKSLKHYGMSSEYAQNLHYGGMNDYVSAEGILTEVPYKGQVKDVVKNIFGGLRSCCTYIGTDNIKYMSKHARFTRVNRIK